MASDTKWAVVSDWHIPDCAIAGKRTEAIRKFMEFVDGVYDYSAWRRYMAQGWRCVRVNIDECKSQ